MNIIAYGLNHRTAPLTLREQLAPTTLQQSQWLRELTDNHPVWMKLSYWRRVVFVF
jgi:glutamyl-tRNA reductase